VFLVAGLAVLFVILLLGALFIFPQYIVDRTIAVRRAQEPLKIADRLKAENDIRTTLLQGLGALVVLAGAVTTWQQLLATLERNRKELSLSQEGQITERFTRAIDQLGSQTLDLRLGGIYALERIANDSPRDRGPIMEVLTAFVRVRAPWPPAKKAPSPTPPGAQSPPPMPSADIQAILTVLGRRVIDEKWVYYLGLRIQLFDQPLDLSKTDLRGVRLVGGHLKNANLCEAHLEGADLIRAWLQGADFSGAHLEKADLREANLEGAILAEAHLGGANLEKADLREAFIGGAHLEGALNLTKEQVDSAYTNYEQWQQARASSP
jgi:hypothetical protein